MTTASDEYRRQAEAAQAVLTERQLQAQSAAHAAHQAHPRAARMAPTDWPIPPSGNRSADVNRATLLVQLKSEMPASMMNKFEKARADLARAAGELRGIEEQRPPLTDSVDDLANFRQSQNDRLHLARGRLQAAQEIYDATSSAVQAELERVRQAHVSRLDREFESLAARARELQRQAEAWLQEQLTPLEERRQRIYQEKQQWLDVAGFSRVENL